MSFLADIYRNFDAHFADENASMVSFPKCTDVGSIIFIGESGCGKYSILGQILEKFRITPGANRREPEAQKAEFHNVMFRIPIIDFTPGVNSEICDSDIEMCKMLIMIIDITKAIPIDVIQCVQGLLESVSPAPVLSVFLHKIDLVDPENVNNVIQLYKTNIMKDLPEAQFFTTSTLDGSSIFAVSNCIESVLPKKVQLKEAMDTFSRSLELSSVFLIDCMTKTMFLSGGTYPNRELLSLCQDGVEMFISITSMMDARGSQTITSIELSDNLFYHYFWSAYDIILAGISEHKLPIATAKNNTTALLHTIKKFLK